MGTFNHRDGLARIAVCMAVGVFLVFSAGVADADKVELETGRTLKGEAEVGSDIVRLDMGKKGVLTLPGVRVASVYDPEKGRNIYFRGEVRGRRGVQMGTIGIARSHGGDSGAARRQQSAPTPGPRRQTGRMGRQTRPRGMRGGPGARQQASRRGGPRGPQRSMQGPPPRQGGGPRPPQAGPAGPGQRPRGPQQDENED